MAQATAEFPTRVSERSSSELESRTQIDWGFLVLGRLDEVEAKAVENTRRELRRSLEDRFPQFEWRLPVSRHEASLGIQEKPVALLERGIRERDRRRWDFALVLTGSDLPGRERPYTLGVSSRSADVAVVSTARLAPESASDGSAPEDRENRQQLLTRRLTALSLHLFGHLNGLEHESEPRYWMYDIREPADLDLMERWSSPSIETLDGALAEVADLRLEERKHKLGRFSFYLGAVWLNWPGILNAIGSARPWLLPFRLSRFTAAASSALLILLLTAEVWEFATSHSPGFVAAAAAAALVTTTTFLVVRQRLLHRRGKRRLTEQIAVTNVAIVLAVALGLLTTYAGLVLLSALFAWLVFPPELIASWTGCETSLGSESYLVLAGVLGSLALLIGALGASFEDQDYLRHVAYIDEET